MVDLWENNLNIITINSACTKKKTTIITNNSVVQYIRRTVQYNKYHLKKKKKKKELKAGNPKRSLLSVLVFLVNS